LLIVIVCCDNNGNVDDADWADRRGFAVRDGAGITMGTLTTRTLRIDADLPGKITPGLVFYRILLENFAENVD